jgi:hypothetical protein
MAHKSKPSLGAAPTKQPEPEWPRHISGIRDCPLRDAVPVNGLVFRRLEGRPEDWQSYHEQGKLVSNAKKCQSTSLSCYADLSALRKIMAVHEEWATQTVVQARLSAEHGVIKQTGNDPNHHSLWLRYRHHATCAKLFTPVSE